jgi:DNA-binding transcriptional MerR regulator
MAGRLASGAGREVVQFGLVEPAEREGGKLLFELSAVSRLRIIIRLRESLGINLAGVAVVLDLVDKYCALQRMRRCVAGSNSNRR